MARSWETSRVSESKFWPEIDPDTFKHTCLRKPGHFNVFLPSFSAEWDASVHVLICILKAKKKKKERFSSTFHLFMALWEKYFRAKPCYHRGSRTYSHTSFFSTWGHALRWQFEVAPLERWHTLHVHNTCDIKRDARGPGNGVHIQHVSCAIRPFVTT